MKDMQGQNRVAGVAATEGKGKRKQKEIKVVRLNTLQPGVLEKTLADIYAKKIRNGTLVID
jgi:hypothetical protein